MRPSVHERNALNLTETAKFFGVSPNTLYKWMANGLVYRRLGPKTIRILKTDVEKYLEGIEPM